MLSRNCQILSYSLIKTFFFFFFLVFHVDTDNTVRDNTKSEYRALSIIIRDRGSAGILSPSGEEKE